MSIGFAPVWQLAQNELTQVVLRGCASCAGSYTGQLEQRTDRRTTGVRNSWCRGQAALERPVTGQRTNAHFLLGAGAVLYATVNRQGPGPEHVPIGGRMI